MSIITVYSFWVRLFESDSPFHVEQVIANSIPQAESRIKYMGYEISKKPYFESSKNKGHYLKEKYIKVR